MNELSGGAPGGAPQQRIEAGPGAYNGGGGDDGGRDLKPWQRGPTGAAAPWAQGRDNRGDDYNRDGGSSRPWASGGGGGDNYGGYGQGDYGAPPGSAAPWQRQQDAPPPPPLVDKITVTVVIPVVMVDLAADMAAWELLLA